MGQIAKIWYFHFECHFFTQINTGLGDGHFLRIVKFFVHISITVPWVSVINLNIRGIFVDSQPEAALAEGHVGLRPGELNNKR